jgi:hypothetical protein
VFDAPQAATDNAVAPVSVKIANRVSRAEVTDIGVLSGRPCNASHNWWRS